MSRKYSKKYSAAQAERDAAWLAELEQEREQRALHPPYREPDCTGMNLRGDKRLKVDGSEQAKRNKRPQLESVYQQYGRNDTSPSGLGTRLGKHAVGCAGIRREPPDLVGPPSYDVDVVTQGRWIATVRAEVVRQHLREIQLLSRHIKESERAKHAQRLAREARIQAALADTSVDAVFDRDAEERQWRRHEYTRAREEHDRAFLREFNF